MYPLLLALCFALVVPYGLLGADLLRRWLRGRRTCDRTAARFRRDFRLFVSLPLLAWVVGLAALNVLAATAHYGAFVAIGLPLMAILAGWRLWGRATVTELSLPHPNADLSNPPPPIKWKDPS